MNTHAELVELLGKAELGFQTVYEGDGDGCPCNATSHAAALDPDRLDPDRLDPDRLDPDRLVAA